MHKVVDEVLPLVLAQLKFSKPIKSISTLLQISKDPFLAFSSFDEKSGRPGLPPELMYEIIRHAGEIGESFSNHELAKIITLTNETNQDALKDKGKEVDKDEDRETKK